jgi:hypothetical protein
VDVLCHSDAFFFCLVRKHRPKRDVTNALDVRHACVELVVNNDAPSRVDLDANVFKAKAIDVWSTTNRNEDNICLELLYKSILVMKDNKRARTVSCFPSFAASVLTMTFPSCFSAESTLVLSLNLKPCLVNDFWNCFLKIVHGKHQGTDGSRGGKNARDFLVDADASDGAEELNDSHF